MKESQKALEKLSLAFTTTSFAGKTSPSPEKSPQLAGRTEEGKRSWGNDKKMLEMEEQLKETKKNQTFPLTPVHVVGKHQGRR